MIDIAAIVGKLAQERPVFHSEADFRHALAWSLHRKHPNSEIRLEVPVITSLGTLTVDVLVRLDGAIYFIELKYKSRAIEVAVGKEKFQLQDHGAQPPGRYDVLKDVQRLGSMVEVENGSYGSAVFLTIDSAYWSHPRSDADTSAAFSLGEGRNVSGLLEWSVRASKGTKRDREEAINLSGNYTLKWAEYSSVRSKN